MGMYHGSMDMLRYQVLGQEMGSLFLTFPNRLVWWPCVRGRGDGRFGMQGEVTMSLIHRQGASGA